MKRARGFTILEVVLALSLGVIVVTSIMLVLDFAVTSKRRDKARSEMQRDGEFASLLMTQELRLAGLGVPIGPNIQQEASSGNFIYGTQAPGAACIFSSHRLLVTGTSSIGFVGDLPRPDSNYNTFGPLDSRTTGVNRDSIAWHNEDNGGCVPNNTNDCSTATRSIFFPGDATACGTGLAANARTCPWGLRRVIPGDRLLIADGGGSWSVSGARGTATGPDFSVAGAVVNDGTPPPAPAGHNGMLSLALSPAFDLGAVDGVSGDSTWKNTQADEGPGGLLGQGFVTGLDRVFYFFDAPTKTLQRWQCWGDPDPTNANWPNDTSATPAVPANPNVTPPINSPGSNTGAGGVCIGPEIVARNVAQVQFTYFNAAGTSFSPSGPSGGGGRDDVHRVAWTLTLTNSTGVLQTQPVTFAISGSTQLQNF